MDKLETRGVHFGSHQSVVSVAMLNPPPLISARPPFKPETLHPRQHSLQDTFNETEPGNRELQMKDI